MVRPRSKRIRVKIVTGDRSSTSTAKNLNRRGPAPSSETRSDESIFRSSGSIQTTLSRNQRGRRNQEDPRARSSEERRQRGRNTIKTEEPRYGSEQTRSNAFHWEAESLIDALNLSSSNLSREVSELS